MNRTRLNIESLLEWAYLSERRRKRTIRRGPACPKNAWRAVARGSTGSYRSAARSVSDLVPHPDSAKIVAAVDRLGFHALFDEDLTDRLLGPLAKLDPNKIAINALRGLKFSMRQLVAVHAQQSTTPDWRRIAPVPRKERDEFEDAVVHWEAPDGTKLGRRPVDPPVDCVQYCNLIWTPPIETIAEARAEYTAWYSGLLILVKELSGKLDAHEVAAPLSKREPWNARILDDLSRRGAAA